MTQIVGETQIVRTQIVRTQTVRANTVSQRVVDGIVRAWAGAVGKADVKLWDGVQGCARIAGPTTHAQWKKDHAPLWKKALTAYAPASAAVMLNRVMRAHMALSNGIAPGSMQTVKVKGKPGAISAMAKVSARNNLSGFAEDVGLALQSNGLIPVTGQGRKVQGSPDQDGAGGKPAQQPSAKAKTPSRLDLSKAMLRGAPRAQDWAAYLADLTPQELVAALSDYSHAHNDD